MERSALSQTDYQFDCGRRLRRIINELGLTYVEAATLMNVSKHVLNHWMKGNHSIEPYALYRLSVLRGVDFNYVFLGDWSRLPFDLARSLEADLKATLAGHEAEAGPADDGLPERAEEPDRQPKARRKAKAT